MDWSRFLRASLFGIAAVLVAILAFVALMDPYGNLRHRLAGPHVAMDLNQRYQFPSIIFSGEFDSLVIGTSTARLLEPTRLEAAFGGRFANLGMNASTAFEQSQLMKLFLREVARPHALVIGIDHAWCAADADVERTTHRGFPPWIYDDNPWNDWLYLLNAKSVEIAGRQLGARLGLEEPRIPRAGFGVSIHDEATYDPLKAKVRIAEYGEVSAAPRRELPALVWLEDVLAVAPREMLKLAIVIPVHVRAQPVPGSPAEAHEAECKRRIAEIGARHGATVVDFRYPSPLTREDGNYWDALHWRLPIGQRIIEGALAAVEGKSGPEWRLLARPGVVEAKRF
ncbi:MAG: hypothetical protein GC150_04690 [Rhizobiales bacterium]|nr:hypothetical protein [Hyphomicrobiales bacterium]